MIHNNDWLHYGGKVHDVRSGKLAFDTGLGSVTHVAESCRNRVAVLDEVEGLVVFDASSRPWKRGVTIPVAFPKEEFAMGPIERLKFSIDCSRVVAQWDDGRITAWNASKGELDWERAFPNGASDFAASANHLAVSTFGATRVWTFDQDRPQVSIPMWGKLAFGSGEILLITSEQTDRLVRYDLKTQAARKSVSLAGRRYSKLIPLPEVNRVVGVDSDTLDVWNTDTMELEGSLFLLEE